MYTCLCLICNSDNELFVGMLTKRHLCKLLEEGDVGQAQVTTFYKAVRAFYMQAMEYASWP